MANDPALRIDTRWRPVMSQEIRRWDLKDLADVGQRYRAVANIPELWAEVTIGADWVAAARLTVQRGRVVMAELRVFPNETDRKEPGRWSADFLGMAAAVPSRGLSARLLRQLKLGELYGSVEQIRRDNRDSPWLSLVGLPLAVERPQPPAGRRPGRPRQTDAFYAAVAAEYVRLSKAGSLSPGRDLAKARGEEITLIRSRLREARKRGLLEHPDRQGSRRARMTTRGEAFARGPHRRPAQTRR